MQKTWVRYKGCKNAARYWREDWGMWVYVPMREGDFNIVIPERVEESRDEFKPYTFKSSAEQKKRLKK